MSNKKIIAVEALEILDSRGYPTIQATVVAEGGAVGTASVPSGASKGVHEACELRDEKEKRFLGKGVMRAVAHVNGAIAKLFHGENVFDQLRLDNLLIEADGTSNKSHLGANAMLAASLAAAKAAAQAAALPLYRYLGGAHVSLLPCPMINIINGGLHADNGLEFQEFMIRPHGAPSFKEALRYGVEIFHTLKTLLKEKHLCTSVGDEGGFAPALSSAEEALDLLVLSIERAGYRPGVEVSLSLDCAASSFYEKGKYGERSPEEQISFLSTLVDHYPIDSIEDGMAEEDWEGWQKLTERLGKKVQLVGDDLFVTNPRFLRKGFELKAANAILIKMNQIGTLSETLECMRLATLHGYATIPSHRSGETEETFLADLSVATSAGQIKTGSVSRSERTAKYNRLLAIELELGTDATFRDSNRCRHLQRCN